MSARSGLLVIREMSRNASALVGIVHLSPAIAPVEGALYLVTLRQGQFEVASGPLGEGGLEPEQEGDVTAALLSRCWRGTSVPDTLTVRFLSAFPDSNGWVLYGASQQPLVELAPRDASGHAWLGIESGATSALGPVANGAGLSTAQLLSTLPVWPDAAGVPHVLPTMSQELRADYHEYSKLLARHGAGDITRAELESAVKTDPLLYRVHGFSVDFSYCQYLAQLSDAGGLPLHGVRSLAQYTADQARSLQIVQAASRMRPKP